MAEEIRREFSQEIATVPDGAGGAGLSNAVDFRKYAGGALVTPATLDNTTVISFQVSQDGVNFYTLYDKLNALIYLTVTLNASRAYPLPDELFGWGWFKVFTCTTGGVAVNQTGAKVFGLCLKG